MWTKTGWYGQKNNYKLKSTKEMKKNVMNAEKSMEFTSKQSKGLKTYEKDPFKGCYSEYAKSLLKGHYDEAEEMKEEEKFEWEEIGDGFYSVGKKDGPKTLCFGSDCVSGEQFKDAKAVKAYVAKKPWPLIMMVGAIYTQRINEIKNKK